MADSAVVASSARRSLVMVISIPEKELWLQCLAIQGFGSRRRDERTGMRLDCGERRTRNRIYFPLQKRKEHPRSWRIQGVVSNRQPKLSPARSVAGLGVLGLFGPCRGISSGILPGNSCGCGGAPGSCTGGGISGFGLPGGCSRGGSVGWPGVAGGISGGSIGITSFHRTGSDNGSGDAMFPNALFGHMV
jgi:hypothetical protein